MKFACVEAYTKSGEIWRPTASRPNYLCDQKREIDVTSFGCWTSALGGEHIPLSWFVTGRKGRPAHQSPSFFERAVHKTKKTLYGENFPYRNLEYVRKFDVAVVCHHLDDHWEMLHFLRHAKAVSPKTLFLGTHGSYNLGRVRERWRNPAWYRSFVDFVNAADLFFIVNRAGVDYLQRASKQPIIYFPPFYPTEYTQRFYRSLEAKEKVIYIAGNTRRLDVMASLLIARELQERHPEFVIRLTDWGEMNLEPLKGSRYEMIPRTPWQEYLEMTSTVWLILNTDVWWTNGRVALDAAAVGTPCIGCNANGQMECFSDLVCADIEGIGRASELAERLLRDPQFYGEIQEKARRRLESYSYENSRRRFETLVSDLRKGKFPEKTGSPEDALEMSLS